MSYRSLTRVWVLAVAVGLVACQEEQTGVELPQVATGSGEGTAGGTGSGATASGGSSGPTRLNAVTVETQRVVDPIVATGSALAVRIVDLAAGLSGRVTDIHVHEGDIVEADQVLVEVDDRTVRAQVQQARAAATAAEVQADLARAEYERLAPLAETGSVSQSRVDQLEAQMEAAQESAEAANAAARAASSYQVDADVKAPFAGTVLDIPAEVGEMATSMPPTILVRLADLSELEVSVQINERFLRLVGVGDEVTVRFPSLDIETVGRIHRIGLEVDTSTRSIEILARVDNTALNLPSGVFAELTITPPGREAIFLPNAATVQEDGVTYAWVVAGSQLARRPIQVIPAAGARVEVVTGLERGETVAQGALAMLEDGAAVELARDGSGADALTATTGATP